MWMLVLQLWQAFAAAAAAASHCDVMSDKVDMLCLK